MASRFRIRDKVKTLIELVYMLLYSALQKLKRKLLGELRGG